MAEHPGTWIDSRCPACAGKRVGHWMDLCDEHLRQWVEPTDLSPDFQSDPEMQVNPDQPTFHANGDQA